MKKRNCVHTSVSIILASFLLIITSCKRDKPVICDLDIYEPNNSFGTVFFSGEVKENSMDISAQISSENDVDFYKIFAREDIRVVYPGTPENFRISFNLIPPPGKDYDLYIYDNTGSPLGHSANRGLGEEIFEFNWVGTAGINDDRYFVIEVRPYSGAWDCEDYILSITMLYNPTS